jgi:hypothetical protein
MRFGILESQISGEPVQLAAGDSLVVPAIAGIHDIGGKGERCKKRADHSQTAYYT